MFIDDKMSDYSASVVVGKHNKASLACKCKCKSKRGFTNCSDGACASNKAADSPVPANHSLRVESLGLATCMSGNDRMQCRGWGWRRTPGSQQASCQPLLLLQAFGSFLTPLLADLW